MNKDIDTWSTLYHRKKLHNKLCNNGLSLWYKDIDIL